MFDDPDHMNKLLRGEKEMGVEELLKDSIKLSNFFTERTYLINNNYIEEIETKLEDLKNKNKKINESIEKLENIKKNIIIDQQIIIKYLLNKINNSDKLFEKKKIKEVLENIEKEMKQEDQVKAGQPINEAITI